MSLIALGRDFARASGPAPPAGPGRADGFEQLTKYIPVETVTLFVAAMAAAPTFTRNLEPGPAFHVRWGLYGACAILTPLIVWLGALREHRRGGGGGAAPLPWWRMLAASVAFCVWALSIPPLLADDGRVAAGLGALFVSIILAQLDPLLDKP